MRARRADAFVVVRCAASATAGSVLGPLALVVTVAKYSPKALGPLVCEAVTGTVNSPKALGPLAVPEPDILSRWRSLG